MLLICSFKLLYKRVCANFHCHIQYIRVTLSSFKKITYIQYRTKKLIFNKNMNRVVSSGKSKKKFQTQETIADDAFLGPQSGMEK